MSFFCFSNTTKLLAGEHALDNLPFELKNKDCLRPLFIADEKALRFGYVREVKKAMKNDTVDFAYAYCKFADKASVQDCDAIVNMYKIHECDCIVALGGEGIINCAKIAKLMLMQGAGDFVYFNHKNEMEPEKALYRDIPLYLLPGDIPSGIESTDRAVLFDKKNNCIYNFDSSLTRATAVILDAKLTDNMPAKAMAVAGLGAMAMAVKGYVENKGNPIAMAYASSAIYSLRTDLLPAMRHNSNADYRLSIYTAIINAGVAYYNIKGSLMRDIALELSMMSESSLHNILQIIFPHYYKEKYDESKIYKSLLMPLVGEEEYAKSNAKTREIVAYERLLEFWQSVAQLAEINTKLRELEIEQGDFAKVAEVVISRYRGKDEEHNNFTQIIQLLEQSF